LLEGDLGADLRERLAEELARLAAALLPAADDVATCLLLARGRSVDDCELLDGDAQLRRERLRRLRRLAVLERRRLGRPHHLFVEVGLALGDVLHEDGEAPWGPEGVDGAVREAQGFELR